MFPEVTKTWNPYVGCLHKCIYCWARSLAEGKLKHLARYRDGFAPKLIEHELKRIFRAGFIFTSDMGDLWGSWVPHQSIEKVLVPIRCSPGAAFLCLTKNPERYHEFLHLIPSNVILGATIETNIQFSEISQAPSVVDRATYMAGIQEATKFISIEPIMAFQLDSFVSMIRTIAPDFVYVGYDNHGHHLPEPSRSETEELIDALEEFTIVRPKTLRKAWWEDKPL